MQSNSICKSKTIEIEIENLRAGYCSKGSFRVNCQGNLRRALMNRKRKRSLARVCGVWKVKEFEKVKVRIKTALRRA